MSTDKFATESADPFASESSGKSLSFRDVKEGHTYTGKVTSLPSIRQARNFETGEPEVWSDGNPVQTVVLGLEVDGEQRSLWAKKPSSMFKALADAQIEAGGRIALGDEISITWTHSEPNKKNPRLNPAKQYKAKLVKADALA